MLCKELGIINEKMKSSEILLSELRIKASSHPAFFKKSKLEDLVDQYNKNYKMNVK